MVETDAGNGYIKGINNPAGAQALVKELIAAELGTWFDLEVPAFAVVDRCDIEIQMVRKDGTRVGTIVGPVFFSSAVSGTQRDASDATFLKRLERKADVAKLVVFDTWIRNFDRHDPRYDPPEENSDNLLYVRGETKNRYRLVPIDHTHCLAEGDIDALDDLGPAINDETIYGRFPEFAQIITADDVAAATQRLSELDQAFVQECVNHTPAPWGFGQGARDRTVELVCQRAAFVVDTIATKLVIDPNIPGI